MPEFTLKQPTRASVPFSQVLAGLVLFVLMAPALAMAQQFDDPLMTDADWQSFRSQQYREFQVALQSNNPSQAERTVLQLGAERYVYSLTLEERRNDLPDVIDDLMNDIYSTLATVNARRVICQHIVSLTPNFLPGDGRMGQPHIVRMNLAILLRRLDVTAPGPQQPAVPYVPARTGLLAILNDGDTRADAKYHAADGLGRICEAARAGVQDGELGSVERNEIAESLVAALESPQTESEKTRFYALQLVEALGDCGLAKNIAGQPIVADALVKVLQNPGELELVRAAAALSLSRLGWVVPANSLAAGVDFDAIIIAVMSLTQELAEHMRTGPGVHTRRSLVLIYFSFVGERPPIAQQQQIGWNNQINRNGLGPFRPKVESAYAVTLPVFQEVVGNDAPRISEAMVTAINDWLEDPANVPPGANNPQGIAAPGEADANPN